MKLSISNLITLSRIIGSLLLLPLDVQVQPTSSFWFLYAFCGITDISDGCVARKLKAETKTGALLDSIADIVFVICTSSKLITIITIPSWLRCLVLIIGIIKLINQVSALLVHRRFVFPHTSANKLTGLMLFVSIPLLVCFKISMPLIMASALAMYAALQEGYIIRTKR